MCARVVCILWEVAEEYVCQNSERMQVNHNMIIWHHLGIMGRIHKIGIDGMIGIEIVEIIIWCR